MPQQLSVTWRPIGRATLLPVAAWAQRSHQGACHNAMVASTALAASRHELEEVTRHLDAMARLDPRRAHAHDIGQVRDNL